MNACRTGGSRREGAAAPNRPAMKASAASASGNSGGAHSPPQMPRGGRRSSSTRSPATTKTKCARALASRRAPLRDRQGVGAPGRERRAAACQWAAGAVGIRARAHRGAEIHDGLRVGGDALGGRCCRRQLPEPVAGPRSNPAPPRRGMRAPARASRCRRGSGAAVPRRARGSRPRSSGRSLARRISSSNDAGSCPSWRATISWAARCRFRARA